MRTNYLLHLYFTFKIEMDYLLHLFFTFKIEMDYSLHLYLISGMVAFRLKGDNALTERLLKRLNGRGYIHAVPACFKGTYVIRFTVTSQRTTNQDILGNYDTKVYIIHCLFVYLQYFSQ